MTQPASSRPDGAAQVRALMRRGQELVATPPGERDDRWLAQTALLGDFAALAGARARLEPGDG